MSSLAFMTPALVDGLGYLNGTAIAASRAHPSQADLSSPPLLLLL